MDATAVRKYISFLEQTDGGWNDTFNLVEGAPSDHGTIERDETNNVVSYTFNKDELLSRLEGSYNGGGIPSRDEVEKQLG